MPRSMYARAIKSEWTDSKQNAFSIVAINLYNILYLTKIRP